MMSTGSTPSGRPTVSVLSRASMAVPSSSACCRISSRVAIILAPCYADAAEDHESCGE